jgi:hypothetical protein
MHARSFCALSLAPASGLHRSVHVSMPAVGEQFWKQIDACVQIGSVRHGP